MDILCGNMYMSVLYHTHIEYMAYVPYDYLISCELIAVIYIYIYIFVLVNNDIYIGMAAYHHLETFGSST